MGNTQRVINKQDVINNLNDIQKCMDTITFLVNDTRWLLEQTTVSQDDWENFDNYVKPQTPELEYVLLCENKLCSFEIIFPNEIEPNVYMDAHKELNKHTHGTDSLLATTYEIIIRPLSDLPHYTVLYK
jgi:hypothetical protein